MRRADTVARMGGDEFVVLLRGSAASRTWDLREIAGLNWAPFLVAGHELHMAASIGIAIYPSDGEDAGKLLKLADVAMYAAKQDGGSGYRRCNALMSPA